ncbi:transposase [Amaricoccus sp.]|uniref:transposase n=1 Tax=Amaricoccus sp. TaxID=1872485 RepID=UPI003FA5B8E3
MPGVKRAWNATIHPVRCWIEKVFGTAKRSYGLARARYLGRPRVSLQVHPTFIAYNLRRALPWRVRSPPDPVPARPARNPTPRPSSKSLPSRRLPTRSPRPGSAERPGAIGAQVSGMTSRKSV